MVVGQPALPTNRMGVLTGPERPGGSAMGGWPASPDPDWGGGLIWDGGGAGHGQGPQEVGQLAQPPDHAILLATVGIIVTGHQSLWTLAFLKICRYLLFS